jgi:phosphoenolpyruvate carboxykinase (ATP)
MALDVTRAMVSAAVSGALDGVELRREPYFGLMVPTECPGVDRGVLDPVSTWADPAEYEATARRLAREFAENMARFEGQIDPRIAGAGPRAAG